MELLLLWIGTTVVCFFMELTHELRIFQDLVDNGYKINQKRISEITKQIDLCSYKTTLIPFLIPIINILFVLKRIVEYNNARPYILDQLRIMDCLTDLTEDELEKYKQNPSAMHAALICITSNENNPLTITYNDGDEKSIVWYKLVNNRPIVIQSVGPFNKLSVFEQRVKLEEKLRPVISNHSNQSPSIEENKRQLETIKKTLLNISVEEKNQNTDNKTLVKRYDERKNN